MRKDRRGRLLRLSPDMLVLDSWNRELVLWSWVRLLYQAELGVVRGCLSILLLKQILMTSLPVGGATVYVHVH